ncbi:MAG: FCD domain-containing protein, partial [Acetobacteraceae bacterium]
DPVILPRLEDILARGAATLEAGELAELPPLNDEFHTLLAQAGRNRALADLMKTLRARTSPLFRHSDAEIERQSWAEHAGILRAVLDGDAEMAALLAYRHVVHAGRMRGIAAPDG